MEGLQEFTEDFVCPILFEGREHDQNNHLHREGVALSLRIHEANALALRTYHRTEVKMQNDQHAREILQSRLQHEEDIDLEKRGAIRENIRDEWMLMSDRAETVFIINTLVLGTAFTMLIEGSLPESVPLQMYTATVAYFCALSAAVCLLLGSVRFAMILRFRVGRTIVEKMRDAIDTSAKKDKRFRTKKAYTKWNRPKPAHPACDVQKDKQRVMPFTNLAPNNWDDTQRSHTDEADADVLFIAPPSEAQEASSSGRLDWLYTHSGRHLHDFIRQSTTQAKPKISAKPSSSVISSSSSVEAPSGNANPFNAGASGKLSVISQNSQQSIDTVSEPETEADSDVSPTPHEIRGDPCPSEDGVETVRKDLDKFEEEYLKVLDDRERLSKALEERLSEIRIEFCKPWDRMAQVLFFTGTLALLCASCLLVFCRFGYRQEGIPEGAASFPAAPLAVAGFCSPIVFTLFVLLFGEYFEARTRSYLSDQDAYHETSYQKRIETRKNSYLERDADDRHERTRQASEHGDKDAKKIRLTKNGDTVYTDVGSKMAKSLVGFSVLNFVGFVVAAFIVGPPDPLWTDNDVQHDWERPLGSFIADSASDTSALNVTVVPLMEGFAWPPFWEPAGASFAMSQSSLVIAGGNLLVEVNIGEDRRLRPRVAHQVDSLSMLIDVCTMPSILGDKLLVTTEDGKVLLLNASGTSLPESVDTFTEVATLLHVSGAARQSHSRRYALDCTVEGSSAKLWLSENESPWPIMVGTTVGSNQLSNASGVVAVAGGALQWPTAWLLAERSIAEVLSHQGGAARRVPQGIVVDGVAIVGINLLLLLSSTSLDRPAVVESPAQLLVLVGAAGDVRWWRKLKPSYAVNSQQVSTKGDGSQPWRTLSVDQVSRRIFLVSTGSEPRVGVVKMPTAW